MHIEYDQACGKFQEMPNLQDEGSGFSSNRTIDYRRHEVVDAHCAHSLELSRIMNSSSQFRMHSAQTRPEHWNTLEDPHHPLNSVWPHFLGQDLHLQSGSDTFHKHAGLCKYQFTISELDSTSKQESIVACARSVPFFWPELDEVASLCVLSPQSDVLQSLPDGGYDTIVLRGMRQYLIREGLPTSSLPSSTKDQEHARLRDERKPHKPNALSAVSIAVRADRRRLGLAEMLIEKMRQTARDESLRILVTPLRPTRKSEFPWVEMESYLSWTSMKPSHSLSTTVSGKDDGPNSKIWAPKPPVGLPFDPWLRKHVQLGGRIAKIAPCSMVVHGSFAEWQSWTGIDIYTLLQQFRTEDLKTETEEGRVYGEVAIAGGLVPLKVYPQEKVCIYIEPNVWMYHQV